MRTETGALEIVGMMTIIFLVVFACWINLVAEPNCEKRGFANVSDRGCYKIENGVRIYEEDSTPSSK